MECRVVTQADIDKIGGRNKPILGQMGVFAASNQPAIPRNTFLGIYEGHLITSPRSRQARENALKQMRQKTNPMPPQNTNANSNPTNGLENFSWTLQWSSNYTSDTTPVISAFSAPPEIDGGPSGCMLSCINTAIAHKSDGSAYYDSSLINVACARFTSNIDRKHHLRGALMGYYTTKEIGPGEPLWVCYGKDMLKTFNQPASPIDLSTYDYQPERDGDYPLWHFDAYTGTVEIVHFDQFGDQPVQFVCDDPVNEGHTQCWVERSPTAKIGNATFEMLSQQAQTFLKASDQERLSHYQHLFEAKDNRVFAKNDIEKGTFLGLYGGITIRKNDVSKLAAALNQSSEAIEDHAWNLYDHSSDEFQYMITAQGRGNVLELVDTGRQCAVQAFKVNIFNAHLGIPSPDTMAYVAIKNIPAGRCLTSD